MKSFLIPAAVLIVSCSKGQGNVDELAALDRDEVSGIEVVAGSPYIWAIEDHGNANILYAFEENGNLAKEVTLSGIKNNDWEDLAADRAGNLYIGDFGNNDNERKDLAIYRIEKQKLDSTSVTTSAVTKFYYTEQKEFPPKKSGRFYDAEAFCEHNGNFYIFTKNRSSGFNGSFIVYKVPNRPGNFPAKKIGELNTCGKYSKCAVAGADISPDGKTIVLLAADRLWLVTGFTEDNFNNAKLDVYELGHNTQKEGVCFKDDDTLLIADEKEDGAGGKLYKLSISALKGETKAK
ncbi:MAG: hypothetical protein ACO1N9_08460 [Flavobacterium sp.]